MKVKSYKLSASTKNKKHKVLVGTLNEYQSSFNLYLNEYQFLTCHEVFLLQKCFTSKETRVKFAFRKFNAGI